MSQTYEPCWQDPRVQRRVRRALGWSTAVLSETQARPWARVTIDRYFSSQNNRISRYLRNQLLEVVNPHWNKDTGQCKTYRLRSAGVEFLCKKLGDYYNHPTPCHRPIVVEVQRAAVDAWIQEDFATEMATGEFDYKDATDRLFHPIQNIRREYKQPALARWGYRWQYDIRSAAPTLILQHARHLGLTRPTATLDEYLAERHLYRQALALELEIPEQSAKTIITALFCGARIGPETAIAQELGNDLDRVNHLKHMTWIQLLRRDIRLCWDQIRTQMPVTYTTTRTGQQRRRAQQPRDKWRVYFALERSVLNQVRTYLRQTHNRHFLEHDGWCCESQIFESELRDHIRCRTGFVIEFDRQELTYD